MTAARSKTQKNSEDRKYKRIYLLGWKQSDHLYRVATVFKKASETVCDLRRELLAVLWKMLGATPRSASNAGINLGG